jgi:hypothetical protein
MGDDSGSGMIAGTELEMIARMELEIGMEIGLGVGFIYKIHLSCNDSSATIYL